MKIPLFQNKIQITLLGVLITKYVHIQCRYTINAIKIDSTVDCKLCHYFEVINSFDSFQ